MGRGDCAARVGVAAFDWKGAEISLDVGEGERAHLVRSRQPPASCAVARATAFTQPALDGGRGVGVAKGRGVALAGDTPLVLERRGKRAHARRAERIDVETLPR